MSIEIWCVGSIIEFSNKKPFWRGMVRQIYNTEVLLADIYTTVLETILKSDLLERVKNKEAKFLSQSNSFNDLTFLDLTIDEQAEVSRRQRYINFLTENGVNKITSKAIPLIEKYAEDLNDEAPHWQSVRTWFKNYCDSGRSLKGLYPRHRFKGRRSDRINIEVINIINIESKRYYKSNQISMASVERNVEAKILAHNLANPSQLWEIPTYVTIRKRVLNYSYQFRKKSREGNRKLRDQLAGSDPVVITHSILERVEMDHTKLDIYVLHDELKTVIGRPNLTVLIDHYSHMVLGFLLSFEPGYFAALCSSCKNGFLPKTHIESLGFISDWPAHGVPETLVTDNGNEFWSKNFDAVADELSIDFQYCPIRTPNYKGTVERFFGTVNSIVLDDLPGVVRKKDKHGEDYDAKQTARLTFTEFKLYFMRWLIDQYHHTPLDSNQKTPYELWVGSEEFFPIPEENESDLLPKIMATATKHLRQGGIHILKLTYNSTVLKDIVRRDGFKEVTIKYDPYDLGYILVLDDYNNAYITVRCTNYDYANGLSVYEHRLIRAKAREIIGKKLQDEDLQQTKVKLNEERDAFHARSVNRKTQVTASRAARVEKIGIEPLKLVIDNSHQFVSFPGHDGDDDLNTDGWAIE